MIAATRQPELPSPDADAQHLSAQLVNRLRDLISHAGPLRFDRYFDEVMYAPGLGYYSAGATRFGAAGDFVTAPEMSPDLARCVADWFANESIDGNRQPGAVLELGAGTGQFAIDFIARAVELRLPRRPYVILERSADLAARQQQLLADAPWPVTWLDTLPQSETSLVIGNEVIDAIAPRRFKYQQGQWQEHFIDWRDDQLVDSWRPLTSDEVDPRLTRRLEEIADLAQLDDSRIYLTDIQTSLPGVLAGFSSTLTPSGLMMLIDYGYSRPEYYHPQRNTGGLIAHYRHHAFDDPLYLPGLVDLSVNVDFDALCEAADSAGLANVTWQTQSNYLLDNGLETRLEEAMALPTAAQLNRNRAIAKLTLPHEMGERFKVMTAEMPS